jgi:signal transduction histidine kinase
LLEELGIMSNLVDDTISSVRRIISELRPEVLDHLDLTSAMEWQIHEFQKRTGIECSFRSNLRGKPFGEDGNTALFRILQETLTNVHRHANATHVRINLSQKDGQVILEVRDNGKGIEAKDISKSGSFGILGMKERVILLKGDMDITGNPGKGTTVRVNVPVA